MIYGTKNVLSSRWCTFDTSAAGFKACFGNVNEVRNSCLKCKELSSSGRGDKKLTIILALSRPHKQLAKSGRQELSDVLGIGLAGLSNKTLAALNELVQEIMASQVEGKV